MERMVINFRAKVGVLFIFRFEFEYDCLIDHESETAVIHVKNTVTCEGRNMEDSFKAFGGLAV